MPAMENLEEKYNRYAAMRRRHLETGRVATTEWPEQQNFADSEKICIFAIRKPIIMKHYDIPELIPQGSGGTHALANRCILEQSGCNV